MVGEDKEAVNFFLEFVSEESLLGAVFVEAVDFLACLLRPRQARAGSRREALDHGGILMAQMWPLPSVR